MKEEEEQNLERNERYTRTMRQISDDFNVRVEHLGVDRCENRYW